MKIILLLLTLLSTDLFAQSGLVYKIYNTKNNSFISLNILRDSIGQESTIVLGESHYTRNIHRAQGDIIKFFTRDFVSRFSVYWEFLTITEQMKIDEYFYQLVDNMITISDFFKFIFPNGNLKKNILYSPIIKAAMYNNGKLYAANAPRKLKKIITSKGLIALDESDIPYNMELGGQHYLKRFTKAMGNHVPAKKIPLYFQAQSYTDSVMAHSVTHIGNNDLNFLIVGSFHSDYNDGVVKQLKKIATKQIISIKLIEVSSFETSVLSKYTTAHNEYGPLGDYLFFIK